MNTFRGPRRGVTLIELMVVIAVIAVLIAVAAPSVRRLLEVQRLRGVSAGLTTDIQFVRAEAASRQEVAGISFRYVPGTESCYTIHTCGLSPLGACSCDCTQPEGSRCPGVSGGNPDPPREIKTVSVPTSRGLIVTPTNIAGVPVFNARVLFDPATGGMASFFPFVLVGVPNPPPTLFVGATTLISPSTSTGAIRTEVSATGRPRSCDGLAACP